MATWLVETSTVVVPMRGANCRWASGGIAWVAVGDREPGRQRLPGRDAHHLSEGAPVQRLLDREHDPGLDRVDVGHEVVDEVVLRQPGEALLVDVEVRQGRGRRCLPQQRADRLALIQPERGDVDQADDVGRIGAEGGDDLAAVGVPGNDGWPVLAGQELAQPGDVIGQPGHRERGAVTLYPSACKCWMTALQLDPSAHAPCTRTRFGSALTWLAPAQPWLADRSEVGHGTYFHPGLGGVEGRTRAGTIWDNQVA